MNRQQRREAARQGNSEVKTTKVDTNVFVHEPSRLIVMNFSIAIRNLQLPPGEAVLYAQALLTGACRLDPKSVEGYKWPTMQTPNAN